MTTQSIDEKIKQALADEEAEDYAQFAEEPSLLAQSLELLHTRNRWLNVGSVLVMIAFLAIGVYSLWMFAGAEQTKSLIGWAMTFGFSMGVVGSLKIWAWMQLEKNSTSREIKRLELQVAMLVKRLEGKRD
jgi:uncharacterized membrane protein YciS (DUF1049 family)